ncbi:MAG TPA: hypothetical protein VN517_09280 [Terriglobales bacterium]|nr:hypothetical protein [Terriglobales bacterium]
MQVRLRALAVLLVLCCISLAVAQAQTPGIGYVTISGSLRGPIYPCGNSSCPTYDSGQVTITINGFIAVTRFGKASQTTAATIAKALAVKLNSAASPVTATAAKGKITVITKTAGAGSNYPLLTAVTYNQLFPKPSFTATPSGPTLSGGIGAAMSSGTLVQEAANNTSLCSSSNDPAVNLAYCTAVFDGFGSNPIDLGVQTLVPGSPAGHVSNLSIKQLMYSGWNGRVLCEYQPWFGLNSHKAVGYNENSPDTIAAQDSYMLAEGCDIALVDYYGSLDPNQSFNLATTNTLFADLNGRSGYPLKFGIMEDKGALKSTCPTSGQTESATVTCLQNALMKEMDYINTHYANSPAYWTDAGQPVMAYFGGKSDWPVLTATDWDSVWSAVKTYTDTYSIPFKYVFQFGSFTANPYDGGRYGWVQPASYGLTQQFWWGANNSSSPVYLDTLYSAGLSHSSQLTIGALYKGFDDFEASWSANRVTAQQCGQVLLNTANEISKYFGGTKPQLPYVQVITWNDYEEGTAIEDGIDNCYTVNSSISGNVLSWSLVASDPVYASTSTVHHFTVYYADASNNLYLAADNLPVSTNSLDLSTVVPPGIWTIYVEMVGQPLIINRMSNGLSYIR